MSALLTPPLIGSIILLAITLFAAWNYNRLLLGLSVLTLLSCIYVFAVELTELFGIGDVSDSIAMAKFIASLWWCTLGYLVNYLVDRFIWHGRLAWDGEPAVPRLLREIAGLFVYLIVAMIILRIVYDQSITVMAATSGVFAIVLGYSAQSTLREIFAGISLNLDAAFKKGDLIEIDGNWGWVKDMNWRSITYQDMERNLVVLPNSHVADSTIKNMHRPDSMMRRTIYFHADYKAPPASVVDLAEQCLQEVSTVAEHPWNFAAFYEYGEIGARYGINFHDWFVAGDQIANALWYKLSRAGIRFGYNRRLNYTSPDEDTSYPVCSQNVNLSHKDALDLFHRIPLFKPLTDGELEQLASSARWCQFGAPEKIVVENEPRDSIFVIAYGRVAVYETLQDNIETRLPDLQTGVPIGILALLTGGLQQTTIRAVEETGLWQIRGEELRVIFDNHEKAMQQISATVEAWQTAEDDALRVRQSNRWEKGQIVDSQISSLTRRFVNLFVQNR